MLQWQIRSADTMGTQFACRQIAGPAQRERADAGKRALPFEGRERQGRSPGHHAARRSQPTPPVRNTARSKDRLARPGGRSPCEERQGTKELPDQGETARRLQPTPNSSRMHSGGRCGCRTSRRCTRAAGLSPLMAQLQCYGMHAIDSDNAQR